MNKQKYIEQLKHYTKVRLSKNSLLDKWRVNGLEYAIKLAEQLDEPQEVIALKERVAVLELALELAIEYEPISCSMICGHDNNYECQSKPQSECINFHKQYLIKQAQAAIKGE